MGFLKDMIDAMNGKRNSKHLYLDNVVGGSFYKMSDIKSDSDIADIRTLIRTMRALADDSQVSTALSYYATDATSVNSAGDIIWATNASGFENSDCAELVNTLFRRWNINRYARDHILELATVGNLYIPTTDMKREVPRNMSSHMYVGLDHNEIPDMDFDIIPAFNVDAENIVHIWDNYEPCGYIYSSEDDVNFGRGNSGNVILPESAVIHFSLGGMIGKYSLKGTDASGDDVEYDIQFADPILKSAIQPTQTLNLLEDATVLSSLIKVIRFVFIECKGADESEIQPTLMSIKNLIEQQMSINTDTGDAQSFLNPQSPNTLIYLPKVNDQEPVSFLDLNMTDDAENADKLLNYYQDKKLSVLGIPKEALNFSSNEGLGGAGSVMSQRSALYANSLQRLETAYMEGWKSAINMYFEQRNLYKYIDAFDLHMNPILTELSTIQFEKRDSAINQASSIIELLKSVNVDDSESVKSAIIEILTDALPRTSSSVADWDIDLSNNEDGGVI